MTQLHHQRPASDRSAWTAANLHDDPRWTLTLSAEQIGDLDVAFRRAGARGRDLFDATSAADFPLPSWKRVFTACKQELLEGFGLVLVRGLPAERYSTEELERIFWGIGLHLGAGVAQNASGDLVGRVYDRASGTLGDRNVRGYQTKSELGFHTDLADVAGLLCVRPARSGGVSRVVSSMRVYDELRTRSREHLEVLLDGFEYDRLGEEAPGESPVGPKVPIFSESGGKLSCRFIPSYIRSARVKMGEPLDATRQGALDALLATVQRPDLVYEMTLARGDIQFVNNYTTLHSRTEFVDHDRDHEKRLLLRLWLEVAGCRSLDARLRVHYGKLGQRRSS